MKKIATYYLLLLYTASLCKPFTIWFSDALAHVYFSHQHTEVHRQYGENHVHHQIGKAAKDDTPAQNKSTQKSEDETGFLHLLTCRIAALPAAGVHHKHTAINRLPVVFGDIILQPPRFC